VWWLLESHKVAFIKEKTREEIIDNLDKIVEVVLDLKADYDEIDIEAEISALEDQLEKAEDERDEACAKVHPLEDEVWDLEDQLSSLTYEKEDLEQELADLQRLVGNLEDDLARAEEYIQDLEDDG
jgi:chromosome segregation ATPase